MQMLQEVLSDHYKMGEEGFTRKYSKDGELHLDEAATRSVTPQCSAKVFYCNPVLPPFASSQALNMPVTVDPADHVQIGRLEI